MCHKPDYFTRRKVSTPPESSAARPRFELGSRNSRLSSLLSILWSMWCLIQPYSSSEGSHLLLSIREFIGEFVRDCKTTDFWLTKRYNHHLEALDMHIDLGNDLTIQVTVDLRLAAAYSWRSVYKHTGLSCWWFVWSTRTGTAGHSSMQAIQLWSALDVPSRVSICWLMESPHQEGDHDRSPPKGHTVAMKAWLTFRQKHWTQVHGPEYESENTFTGQSYKQWYSN